MHSRCQEVAFGFELIREAVQTEAESKRRACFIDDQATIKIY